MKYFYLLMISLLVLFAGCKNKAPKPEEIVLGEFEFLDSRDSQIYSWVKIGGQIWMEKNLNFATESGSWCYNNQEANCVKFGRLYSWNAARTACPEGWHLSTDGEWASLDAALGMYAGTKLKSGSGWQDNGGGSGSGGFNALPGGDRNQYGTFTHIGSEAYFWTASQPDATGAYGRFVTYNSYDIGRGIWDKQGGNSVRCVKNRE